MSQDNPFGRRAAARGAIVLAAVGLAVIGCSSTQTSDPNDYSKETQTRAQRIGGVNGAVTGDNGLLLFGPGGIFGGDSKQDSGGGGIGVNTYLWRATLDTLAFMPLASADPFGGVIISEWYSPPDTPTDRFKVNIYILDRQLRADGVRASVFRQHQETDGRWVDASVDPATHTDLENAILTRARQLRISTAQK
jgi:Domain of unknown function (DUF3576)